jgi:hypothetical protein
LENFFENQDHISKPHHLFGHLRSRNLIAIAIYIEPQWHWFVSKSLRGKQKLQKKSKSHFGNMAGPSSVGTVGSAATPRIPMALQQVFMASQRGDDVEEIAAPKGNTGFRIFKRAWGAGRRQKKAKPMKAPTKSSLSSDRSNDSIETAADASRKAMQLNAQTEVSIFMALPNEIIRWNFSVLTLLWPGRNEKRKKNRPRLLLIRFSNPEGILPKSTAVWKVDTTVAPLLCSRPAMEVASVKLFVLLMPRFFDD